MLEVGWSFILWSMLYLEGWSSRSSYFIGAALCWEFAALDTVRELSSIHFGLLYYGKYIVKIINVTNESKLVASVPRAYMAAADAKKQFRIK